MRRRLIGLGLVAAIGSLSYCVYCSLAPRPMRPEASEAVAAERVQRPAVSRVRARAAAPAKKPTPEALATHVHNAAARHGVPPTLLAAVIAVESEFNPRAVSNRGAVGLMQLMPMTAVLLGVRNAYDPHENVHGGARYLRDLLERFDYDVPLALAAYNAGPQAVVRHRGIPPYPETRQFVARVMHRMREPKSGGVVMATVAAKARPAPVMVRLRVDTSVVEPPGQEPEPSDAVRVSLNVADIPIAAPARPVVREASVTLAAARADDAPRPLNGNTEAP
jgi:hypothetical protein